MLGCKWTHMMQPFCFSFFLSIVLGRDAVVRVALAAVGIEAATLLQLNVIMMMSWTLITRAYRPRLYHD